MSCGDHVYQAHCDLADGFLFHMRGRKRVRVWPVPPYMKKTDKFNLYFFEPSRFTREAGGPQDDMPAELLRELAGVLQSKQIDAQTMRRLLSNWWRLANSRTLYQGPYPERT